MRSKLIFINNNAICVFAFNFVAGVSSSCELPEITSQCIVTKYFWMEVRCSKQEVLKWLFVELYNIYSPTNFIAGLNQ